MGWPGSPAHPLPGPHRGSRVALWARYRSSPRPGRPAGRDAAGRGCLPESRAEGIYRESKEPLRLHSGLRWGSGTVAASTAAASLQPPQSQPPTLPVAPCDCGPRGQLLNGSRRAHPAQKRPRRIQVGDARARPGANAPCAPGPAAALASSPRLLPGPGLPAPGCGLPRSPARSPARLGGLSPNQLPPLTGSAPSLPSLNWPAGPMATMG